MIMACSPFLMTCIDMLFLCLSQLNESQVTLLIFITCQLDLSRISMSRYSSL